MVDLPVYFVGSEEEKTKNFYTHRWFDGRCTECDSKPSHAAAEYPCGQEPPRINMSSLQYTGLMQVKIDYLNGKIGKQEAIDLQKQILGAIDVSQD